MLDDHFEPRGAEPGRSASAMLSPASWRDVSPTNGPVRLTPHMVCTSSGCHAIEPARVTAAIRGRQGQRSSASG